MSLRQKAEYLTLLVLVLLLLLSACATATKFPAITLTPSTTATTTAAPQPTSTPTPTPISKNLLNQKDILEQNGFVFSDGEITHQDKAGKVWEVIKFNADGSAIVQTLDENYGGTETSFTAEEVANVSVELLNAGHDPIIAVNNKETGKVEMMFLANVDKANSTEAGWVPPLEISSDPHNPTKIVNAAAVHTRHVDYSVLLGNGSEPWPTETPAVQLILASGSAYNDYFKDKLDGIRLVLSGVEGFPIGRSRGFLELNTPEGRILVNLIQSKISQDSQSIILKAGYSGEILVAEGFYENDLPKVPQFMIYQAVGNKLNLDRGGLQGMPGVRHLYERDIDNYPPEIFSEEVQWLINIKLDDVRNNVKTQEAFVMDTEMLEDLQKLILHPLFN